MLRPNFNCNCSEAYLLDTESRTWSEPMTMLGQHAAAACGVVYTSEGGGGGTEQNTTCLHTIKSEISNLLHAGPNPIVVMVGDQQDPGGAGSTGSVEVYWSLNNSFTAGPPLPREINEAAVVQGDIHI